MKKKGIQASVVNIILIALFALFLIAFLVSISKGATTAIDRTACQASLIMQEEVRPTGNTVFSAQCPTYDVVIGDHEITRSDSDRKETFEVITQDGAREKYSELKEEYVYQVTSDEMEYCWDLFFRGERDVFSRSWFGVNKDGNIISKFEDFVKTWKGKNVCFVCSTVRFDTQEDYTFDNFEEYVKNEPAQRDKEERSYYDFLAAKPEQSEYGPEYYWRTTAMKPYADINSNKRYLVIFVKKGGTSAIGAGDYFSAFTTADTANDYCTHWVYPSNR